jgi:hypothetical protein
MKGEKIFLKKIFMFSAYKEIVQCFRLAEKSDDNHSKHFRKLIMYWYYENILLELFVQKCYKSREKYVLK